MMRLLFGRLSPAGRRSQLPILIFHRVRKNPDPLMPGEIDAAQFDRVCGWLAAWFNVIALDDAVNRLEARSLPERSLAITFDDGYADNHDVALPILKRHRLPATFFIATGFLDGGRMWNDTIIETVRRTRHSAIDPGESVGVRPGVVPVRTLEDKRSAVDMLLRAVKHLPASLRGAAVARIAAHADEPLPDDLMMSSRQIVALRDSGMQIGAHTVSHPILALLDSAAIRAEMTQSKRTLERLLHQQITLFAYPNGRPIDDYDATAVAIAREVGFGAAVTTARGTAAPGSDLFQLPRLAPWDRSRMKFGMRLAGSLLQGRPAGARDRA